MPAPRRALADEVKPAPRAPVRACNPFHKGYLSRGFVDAIIAAIEKDRQDHLRAGDPMAALVETHGKSLLLRVKVVNVP